MNVTDPSGLSGVADQTAAANIASSLSGAQANFAFNFGMAAICPPTAATSIVLDCAAILVPGAGRHAATLIGTMFSKGKVFKLGQGRAAPAKSLEIFGAVKIGKAQAHHIVPYGDTLAAAVSARAILSKYKIDINSR